MTDQELIDLVRTKAPEELTLEELAELRARLADSPELQQALAGELRLEGHLVAALGGSPISVNSIYLRARQDQAAAANPAGALLIIGASLVLMFLVLGVFAAAWLARPLAERGAIALKDNSKTAQESETKDELRSRDADGKSGQEGGAASEGAENASRAKLPLTVEAERFARGNVKIDSSEWGSADVTVIRTDSLPAFAEYDVYLPEAGTFPLRLRYASFDSRPLRLTINDQPQPRQVAGEQTGGHAPNSQKWFYAGEYEFREGKNVIRLETTAYFPHLDQFVIGAVGSAGETPAGTNLVTAAEKDAPWREALDRPGEPPAFADVCFDTFRTDKTLPQRDDLHRWFAPVEGQRYRVYDGRTRLGPCAAFEGLIRLKAPWQNDSALKISLENYDRLQLHFFAGARGVTLVYHEGDGYRWAAYTTARKANEVRPSQFALAATDEARNRRSEIRFGGPFDLRHRNGELILSRGDIVLLRVPLAEPPQEVYFDGRASFHGLAFIRTEDFPEPESERPATHVVARPADLPWAPQFKRGIRFDNLPEGAVELRGDNAPEKGWVLTPLPRAALREVVFEIEGASAGAGVFLAREGTPPIEVLRFMRNRRDGELCLSMRTYDDSSEADFGPPAERLTPATSGRVWLKLLFGIGLTRWWMSGDGVHWVQPEFAASGFPGGITHLGLHCAPRIADCRIRLNRIEHRELPEFSSLAAAEAREAAMPFANSSNFGEWHRQVDQARPDPFDAQEWRRACAIKSLAAGCSQELGWSLVEFLLDDAAMRELPLERRLGLLTEAVLLCDMRYHEQIGASLLGRYRQAGLDAFERHGARPFSSIRHSIMSVPFSNQLNLNIRQVYEPAIRAELIQLLSTGQWEETQRFCERLRFFQQHDQLPLVEWAEFTARRHAPARPGADQIGRQREEWRHPYSEQLNKETYNLLAELQAILESDALEDAARMITSLDANAVSGVAPHAGDRDLFVSVPAAVRLALKQHPALEAHLRETYGPLAQLRIRTAIAENNAAALRLAAVQFEATAAAAEAHRWLGDKALSSGHFARALAEYRRAEATAEPSLREDLAHRKRLAAAMLGEEQGSPATREVHFGETRLAPSEFESLVAEMKNRTSAAERGLTSPATFAPSAPPLAEYKVEPRSRLEGPLGENPSGEVTRNTNRYKADWASRQLAAALEGSVLYTSNRFHASAYDLETATLKWRGEPPPGKMLRAQDYTFSAMRPLVLPQRVIVRLLYGNGPLLACFEKETGKFLWSSEQRQNEFLVSDPLLLQDQLVCLTLARPDQRESLLRLTTFDLESGEIITQHPLLELRESWWLRRYCETVALDDSLVAALGGLVVCADLSGNVRWARRQIALPAEEESSWVLQNFDRPLLHGGRLYVAQPGVRSLECLDPETGARHWSVVLPGLLRMFGIASGKLVVETDRDLRAYDAQSGAPAWKHETNDLLFAHACGGSGGVLFCRREPTNPERKQFAPQLVWLDPDSGAERGKTLLARLEDSDPRIGPLIPFRDRLFTFFGRGQHDANRELFELIPAETAAP